MLSTEDANALSRITPILSRAETAPDASGRDAVDLAAARIREALALIDAIDAGELLAALPEDPAAQARHETAVHLLDVVGLVLRSGLQALSD